MLFRLEFGKGRGVELEVMREGVYLRLGRWEKWFDRRR